MISTPVSRAIFFAKYSSGIMITFSTPSDSITFTALPEVQQISLSAFTAADVFTYVTTGTPGCCARSVRTSAAVIDSAKEQPASGSGITTFFAGVGDLAV